MMSELHREEEFGAERFASALESAERGHALDQRDLEDATLAPIINTAGLLRRSWNAITPDPDYFARSRATILAAMPLRPAQADAPLSLLERLWRSPVLTPIASAAAAGLAAVFITLQFAGGGASVELLAAPAAPAGEELSLLTAGLQPAPAVAPTRPAVESLDPPLDESFVTLSDPVLDTGDPLDRLARNIGVLSLRSQLREPISAELLHDISEDLAGITQRISSEPDAMTREDVIVFARQAVDGVTIMQELLVEFGASGALATARVTAELGRSTAAVYFYNNPPN